MSADEYLTYAVTDGPWKMQHEDDGTIGLYLIRPHRDFDEQITRIARFDRVEDAEFTPKHANCSTISSGREESEEC